MWGWGGGVEGSRARNNKEAEEVLTELESARRP
jgi:hypothetical protein